VRARILCRMTSTPTGARGTIDKALTSRARPTGACG